MSHVHMWQGVRFFQKYFTLHNSIWLRHAWYNFKLSFKGHCSCENSDVETIFFVQPGQSQALVSWVEPKFTCETNGNQPDIKNIIVNPLRESPSYFSPGEHVITYTYAFQGDVTITCPVTINVIGELQTIL